MVERNLNEREITVKAMGVGVLTYSRCEPDRECETKQFLEACSVSPERQHPSFLSMRRPKTVTATSKSNAELRMILRT